MGSGIQVAIAIGLVVALAIGGIVLFLTQRRAEKAKSLRKFREYATRGPEQLERDYAAARAKLEKNWAVIEFIHDYPERGSLGPAGLPQEIDIEHAQKAVSDIHAAKNASLAIIIHTLGGSVFATDMIAKALNDHKGEKVAFVPYVAMSGGTMVALATPRIVMGKGARLGPIDSQYWGFPAGAWRSLVEAKGPSGVRDEFLLMSYVVQQYSVDEKERARKRVDKAHQPGIADRLIDERLHHSEAIYAAEARQMGVMVSEEDCPKEVYTLVDCKLKLAAFEREDFFRKYFDLKPARTVINASLWARALGFDPAFRPPENL